MFGLNKSEIDLVSGGYSLQEQGSARTQHGVVGQTRFPSSCGTNQLCRSLHAVCQGLPNEATVSVTQNVGTTVGVNSTNATTGTQATGTTTCGALRGIPSTPSTTGTPGSPGKP